MKKDFEKARILNRISSIETKNQSTVDDSRLLPGTKQRNMVQK